jgi:hypothetical protein
MRVLRDRKSRYASAEMTILFEYSIPRFQESEIADPSTARRDRLASHRSRRRGKVLLVSLASLQVKREQRKGLRPILFNPCSAPATPTQTWGTRPGGKDSAESSAALLVTKRRVGVSSGNRFEGSQVSKARPHGTPGQAGAPFDFTLRCCRRHKLCRFSPDSLSANRLLGTTKERATVP